jgi:drug/metabolite transporter (DMT)-like permease
MSLLVWTGAVTLAAGLCTAPFGWQPLHAAAAAWFLAAGLCNALAHFMLIEAFRLGDAAVVAPFRYSGLLWAMLIGYIGWGELPTGWMLAGAGVVVIAGIYMLRASAWESAEVALAKKPAQAPVRNSHTFLRS